MSATVGEILQSKSPAIFRVNPESSVYDALTVMAKHNISGVLVMEGERLVGIFTERDYARKVILQGRHSRETKVGDLMTRQLITISPNHSVDLVMQIMTEKRVRHLPVLEHGALLGVITIGDAVKAVIDEQGRTIRHLSGYIAGDITTS